jgi:hypothetical protein
MKSSPRFSRIPSNLSESCHERLNAYAIAGAAGLGMLTLVPPAGAKIVYTPANEPLMNQYGVLLDLNHDGISDFSFYGISTSNRGISTFVFALTVSPVQRRNAIWGVESHEHASCAAALPAGVRVGPKRPFQPNREVMFDVSGGPLGGTAFGRWGGKPGMAYLGLKFSIEGKEHFGWARVKITNTYTATLTGYAYETIPNKPILTGKTKGTDAIGSVSEPIPAPLSAPARAPATLGMLALGQPAFSAWRRREPSPESN